MTFSPPRPKRSCSVRYSRIEQIVGSVSARIRRVRLVAQATHVLGGIDDRVVSPGRGAGDHRAEDRGSECRRLPGAGNREPAPGDVGVDLHQELVPLGESAARDDLVHSHASALERLDDHSRPEGSRFDQRAIDLGHPRRERHADEQSAQVGVDEHRAVPVPPVEREQAALARPQPRGFLRQQLVDIDAALHRELVVGARHRVLDEPGEDVANGRLARFIAEKPRHDPVLDNAAHPVDIGECRRRGGCGRCLFP